MTALDKWLLRAITTPGVPVKDRLEAVRVYTEAIASNG